MEDLTFRYFVAVLLKGLLSFSWPSLELSSKVLDWERFFVMAIVCSPIIMYRSFPTGRVDLRENLACRCPDFLSPSLPPRTFSGQPQFSKPSSVWPRLLRCCFWLSLAHQSWSSWLQLLMPFSMASWEREVVWFLWMWFGQSRLWFSIRPLHIFGNRFRFLYIPFPPYPVCPVS